MFELPFRIDKPLAIALFLGPVTGLFIYLYVIFNNENGRFRKAMEFILEKWQGNLPPGKRLVVIRSMLIGNIILFGLMAVFTLLVGTGVIKNKERKPLTPEDIQRIERMMEERGLKKRPNPALEQMMEKRGLKKDSRPKPDETAKEAAPNNQPEASDDF